MNRTFASFSVAVLLTLLVGTQLSVAPVAATSARPSDQTTPNPAWIVQSDPFRRAVTVVNNGPFAMVNQIVILHLNFSGDDVEDPVASIRLVNQTSQKECEANQTECEVPSVVVGAEYSGIFLRSAYLLFLTNVLPHSNASFYVYYGGGSMVLPFYRVSNPISSLGNSFMTAQVVPETLDSTQLQIGFGTADSESTMSKVSYIEGAAQQYGSTLISPTPFTNDTGWIDAGSIGSSIPVAYDTLQAGSLQVTEILVLYPGSAVTIDAVANEGTTPVSDVRLTSVIGLEGLSTFGFSQSIYNASSGLLYTQNPDGYFGVNHSSRPLSFELGPAQKVLLDAARGSFSGISSSSRDSAAGFVLGLGDLSPAVANWVASSWSFAASFNRLSVVSTPAPVSALMGQQDILDVATPTARSLWSAQVALNNVTIPASGLTIPFRLSGASFVPSVVSIDGTYDYSVPPPASANPRAWTATSSSTGNGTAYASPSNYAFDVGRSVESLSGFVPNAASTATAGLTSNPEFAFGGPTATLEIRYKASHTVQGGNFSAQDFFVAVDFDPTMSNNFNESMFLPVSGSSTTFPAFGCPGFNSTGFRITRTGGSGYLIADGVWRTFSASLPSSLPSHGFDMRLRMCISSVPGFSGFMSLDVASVGIVLRGSASSILQASVSYAAPEVSLDYLPEAAGMSPAGAQVNLTLSLLLQANSEIGWADGATFAGVLSPPRSLSINYSSAIKSARLSQLYCEGILVSSAVAKFANMTIINGARAPTASSSGSLFLAAPSAVASQIPFTVHLKSQPTSVIVLDQDGERVPDVNVVLVTDGIRIGPYVTDASGSVQLQLVPWSFTIDTVYQGVPVGSDDVVVGSQPSISISSNLYKVSAQVRDFRSGPVGGAEVVLTTGNYSLSGLTNGRGIYSFEAVANAVYNVTVSVGSESYFSGQLTATSNNEVVALSTSYIPPSIELLIVALIAVVPTSGIVTYYVARWLKRPK